LDNCSVDLHRSPRLPKKRRLCHRMCQNSSYSIKLSIDRNVVETESNFPFLSIFDSCATTIKYDQEFIIQLKVASDAVVEKGHILTIDLIENGKVENGLVDKTIGSLQLEISNFIPDRVHTRSDVFQFRSLK